MFFGIFLLALAVQVFLFRDLLASFFPIGDDLSPIVHSAAQFPAHGAAAWFTEGYSRYYLPYPEWTRPTSDYLRPFMNCVLYAASLVTGRHWGGFLLLNYLFHALGVGAGYVLARSAGASRILAATASLVLFLNPGIQDPPMLTRVSFLPDLLVAASLFAAFLAIRRGALGLAAMALVLACFSKGTGVLAPLGGALTLLWLRFERERALTRRDLAAAAGLAALPIALWSFVRLFVYKGTGALTSSVYAIDHVTRPVEFAKIVVKNFTVWPLGLFESLPSLQDWVRFGPWKALGLGGLLITLLNAVLWAVAGGFVWRGILALRRPTAIHPRLLVLVPFAAVLLATLLVVESKARYGYPYHLFLVPLLLVWAGSSPALRVRGLVASCLLAMVVNGVLFLQGVAGPQAIEQHVRHYEASRQLSEVLRSEGAGRSRIFLVNDLSGKYGVHWLPELAGIDVPIELVNGLDGFEFGAPGNAGAEVRISAAGDVLEVSVKLAEPLELRFIRASVVETLGREFRRNPRLFYRFPERRVLGTELVSGEAEVDLGHRMLVELRPEPGDLVVYFDPATERYRAVDPADLVAGPA